MTKNFSIKNVVPCGVLTVGNRQYFLLNPEPISKDSWQLDSQQRFVVVPCEPITNMIGQTIVQNGMAVYDCARHIVCSNPAIEYMYIEKPIQVVVLQDQVDVLGISNNPPAPKMTENEWQASLAYAEKVASND